MIFCHPVSDLNLRKDKVFESGWWKMNLISKVFVSFVLPDESALPHEAGQSNPSPVCPL